MNRLTSFIVAAGVVLLDRATKIMVQARLNEFDHVAVIPGFFNIVHTENRGAAFGMLSGLAGNGRNALLIVLSLVISFGIAAALWQPARAGVRDTPVLRWGLSLVLGGALGNLWDRVAAGSVTDFLQFFFGSWEFASFNAADSAITVGAGLLILDMWLSRHHHNVSQATLPR